MPGAPQLAVTAVDAVCCAGSHFPRVRGQEPASLPASACEKENEMSDEAERPEQGDSLEFLLAVVRHLLNQPIRSDICLPPAGIEGNGDPRRCQACRYFLPRQESQ